MPTYLLEIDFTASGPDQIFKFQEKFSNLVKSLSNAPPDPDFNTESGSRESDCMGLEGLGRGIIVSRSRTLKNLTKILEPHLSQFPIAPKITQTEEKGVYGSPGYTVQQLLIFVPVDQDNSDEKFQKLKTLLDVTAMTLEKQEKISGMRYGEVTSTSTVSWEYKGKKCRVWSVWLTWVSLQKKHGEEGEEGESLASRFDWGEMGDLMWEERNWSFDTYECFLREESRCVVM